MDEEFIRELLYQIKADNAVIQFKEYLDGSALAHRMFVFLKSNKKMYNFKMTKEEIEKIKFLIDITEEER